MPAPDNPAALTTPVPPARSGAAMEARVQLGGDDPGIAFQLGGGGTQAWMGLAGQASYLTLLDGEQRVRGQLALGADGPRITLADISRRARAQVRLGAEGAGIALLDEAGETRIWLGLAGDSSYLGLVDGAGNIHGRLRLAGRSGLPGLSLADEQGTERAVVAMEPDGPQMDFLSPAGEVVARLAVSGLGAWLALVDAAGQPAAELAVTDRALVALRDGEQRRRVVVGASGAEAEMAILRPDGERAAALRAMCVPLWNARGHLRAHLGLTPGGAAIRLFGADGVQRAALAATAEGPSLAIAGEQRQGQVKVSCGAAGPELSLGAAPGGGGAAWAWCDQGWQLRLTGPHGEPRAELRQTGDGPPEIELWDAGQRPRLRQQSPLLSGEATGSTMVLLSDPEAAAAQVRLSPELALLPGLALAGGAASGGELRLGSDGPSLSLDGAAGGGLRLTASREEVTVWSAATPGGSAQPWLQLSGDRVRLAVVDGHGRVRGAWVAGADGASLQLAGASAETGAELQVTSDGLRLGLMAGNVGPPGVAWFGMGGDAASYLGLLPEVGPLTAMLAANDQAASLAFLDPAAQQRAELAVDAEGPRLTLAAGNRRTQAQIRMQAGGPAIAFLDDAGVARGWLALDTD